MLPITPFPPTRLSRSFFTSMLHCIKSWPLSSPTWGCLNKYHKLASNEKNSLIKIAWNLSKHNMSQYKWKGHKTIHPGSPPLPYATLYIARIIYINSSTISSSLGFLLCGILPQDNVLPGMPKSESQFYHKISLLDTFVTKHQSAYKTEVTI